MPGKILIIEDSSADADLMRDLLIGEDFTVIVASTGEDGLEKVRSEIPDLVIIDTILPGIDGFEVCKRIKEDEELSSIKIIITTGKLDAIDATTAKMVGADDYAVKTSDCEAIVEAVRRIL